MEELIRETKAEGEARYGKPGKVEKHLGFDAHPYVTISIMFDDGRAGMVVEQHEKGGKPTAPEITTTELQALWKTCVGGSSGEEPPRTGASQSWMRAGTRRGCS